MAKANSAAPFRVIEGKRLPTGGSYSIIRLSTFWNATIFGGLQDLLLRMDASQRLRVVVFERRDFPDFYLAHFDLTGKNGEHHDSRRAFRPPRF